MNDPESHPPAWLRSLAARAHGRPDGQGWFAAGDDAALPAPQGARASAVLVLFGPDGRGGSDVVLTARASGLRSHAGQTAFPGGAADPGDRDLVATALREAEEEIGLPPSAVRVLAQLTPFPIAVSGYAVTPVLGWWSGTARIWARDPREVDTVLRIPVDRLLDPAHRFQVRHPRGYVGAAFEVDGLLVWGFTARVLDQVLDQGGLTRPWDTTDLRPITDWD